MSRYVVTVGTEELNALQGAVNKLADAIMAITPPAGDELQSEAVVAARCALLVALKASKELKLGSVRVEK